MAYKIRSDDGREIRYWEPFETQQDFLKIPDSIKEAFFGGKVGGGKSDVLVQLPVVRNWINIPGFNGVLWRRTFPQLEESLIPRTKDYYGPIGGHYNQTKHFWTFGCKHPHTGKIIGESYVRLLYLDTLKDAEQHDTAEFPYQGFDELTHIDRWAYLYMLLRNRSSLIYPDWWLVPELVGEPFQSTMRSASNPGNIGHAWVKNRFISPAPSGYKLIRDFQSKYVDEKGVERFIERIFIPSSIEDNRHIANREQYIASLKSSLSDADYKAKVLGDWDAFSGQVFDELLEKPLPGAEDQRSHVCEPFQIPVWWPRFVAIDWGFVHPTAILWAALSPEGKLYIYREYLERGKKVSQWAAEFAAIANFDPPYKFIKLDKSGSQERGVENTVEQEFYNNSGFTVQLTSGNQGSRLAGKLLIHEYLRMTPRPIPEIKTDFDLQYANRLMRLGNMSAYSNYLNQYKPVLQDENLPKIQFFVTCRNTIETLKMCVYEEHDKAKGKRAEDVKKWDSQEEALGDDLYDCMRYLIDGVDAYLQETKAEAGRLKELGNIHYDLQVTGDQTAFYRRMEYLERNKKSKSFKHVGSYRKRPRV